MNALQKKNLEKRVHDMLYSNFTVQGVHYHVVEYEITDIKLVLKTDTKEFNILHANVERMLDMFIPVAENPTIDITPAAKIIHEEIAPAQPDPEPVVIAGPAKIEALSTSHEIRNVLMDNIRKLQKDKSYIHQAAAINDSVKTLIDFAKTEISAQELAIKMNQGLKVPANKQLS